MPSLFSDVYEVVLMLNFTVKIASIKKMVLY